MTTVPIAFPAASPIAGGVVGSQHPIDASLNIRKVLGLVRNTKRWRSMLMPMLAGNVGIMTEREMSAKTIEWPELNEIPRNFALTATPSNPTTDTTLAVGTTNIAYLSAGDLLAVFDGGTSPEMMVVNAVDRSAGTFTVYARGASGGAAAKSLASGMLIHRIGNAIEEGRTTITDPVAHLPVMRSNGIVQMDQSDAFTDLAAMFDYYGGDLIALQRDEGAWRYITALETMLLFSHGFTIAGGQTGGGTYGRRSFTGWLDALNDAGENIEDMSAGFGYDDISDILSQRQLWADKVGGDAVYYMVCSTHVQRRLDAWPENYHRADHMAMEEYGFRVKRIFGSGWTAVVVPSTTLENDDHRDWCMCIPAQSFSLIAGTDKSGTYHRDVTGPSVDGSHLIQSLRTGLFSCRTLHTKAHVLLTGIN